MNLDFTKICSKHSAVYEAYYKQIDPNETGAIEAMTAAKFLKKSGLSDVVLSRIWDLSDPNGKGFLEKPGFFIALKLVSLAQAGLVSNMNNIYMETPNPPKIGDIPNTMPSCVQPIHVRSGGIANDDWSISIIDRLKYEQLFESLKPINNMLPGNKVKGVLMDSKLPMETLGTIWDLADQDKDGNLDKDEFIVAMHLVYQTLQKRTIPSALPPELRKPGIVTVEAALPRKLAPTAVPRAPSGEGFADNGFIANFPKDIGAPAAIPLPVAVPPMTRIPPVGAVTIQPLIQTGPLIPIGAPSSVTANSDWVVTPSDLQRYEVMFRNSDRDKDGLVSGTEVKDVFLKSGVHQKCLAHIWALCDTNQSGKLTMEQFALAMWMVERKQKSIDPPQVLTASMIPPSIRGLVSGVDLQRQEPKPTYTNPELEMISKEIEELARERRVLETEIAQKEADVRIKNGEVRSLQNELDTLSVTLKQLEHQRGEAQKRLDDLHAQVSKIHEQCQKQEETINEQEGELNTKRSKLQELKDEEDALQKEYDANNIELTKLTQHLQSTQLQISSVRSMVTQLLETQRQMTDALLICRAAIENQNAELVSEYQLKIEPDFVDACKVLEKEIEEPKADPFGDATNAGTTLNSKTVNGLDNDLFMVKQTNPVGFNVSTGFNNDFDAFAKNGDNNIFGLQNKDQFAVDTFESSRPNVITPEPCKDNFESDPFAALHAPTSQDQVLSPHTQKSGPPPRPESPSPALPPKKSKVPPPRPAPPRPVQAPARTTARDPFGGSGSFADFDDFDNKITNFPTPSTTPIPNTTTLLDNLDLFENTRYTNNTQTLSTSITASALSLKLSTTTTTSTTFNTSKTIAKTTALTTITMVDNQLSRSNTPMQHIQNKCESITKPTVTNVFDAFVNNTNETNKTNNNDQSRNQQTIIGPTDFKDDPFKNYRYEDPFNIKDPFGDDDNILFIDTETVFKDDFNSEDEHAKQLHTDFFQKFDAFNLNPNPVPSYESTHSKKSESNTPLSAINAFSAGLFDTFSDLDPFLSKTTMTHTKMGTATATRNNNNAAITLNNSYFDAFNDNFETQKTAINMLEQGSKNANQFATFDAFGTVMTTNQMRPLAEKDANKLFCAFNDNFETDFANMKKIDNNLNSTLLLDKKTNCYNAKDNKTALDSSKFDALDLKQTFSNDFPTGLNNSIDVKDSIKINLTKVQNIKNNNQLNAAEKDAMDTAAVKVAEKFSDDYSRADTFETDLQEALKRSMLDN